MKVLDDPSLDNARDLPPSVLHLVGRVTDTVFSFLGPMTAALADRGTRQTVVLMDDPAHRHLLPKFHPSVRLVLSSAKGGSGDRLQRLMQAYCDAAESMQPAAAHLHGVVCSMIGMYAAVARGAAMPSYFSPHGSKSLGPLRGLGTALLRLLRPLHGRFGQRAIVNSGPDARALGQITRQAVELVESPVAEAFFNEPLAPGKSPRIVTCWRAPNPLGAAQFAQCAVLLADLIPGLKFAWLGVADAESVARLRAAGVTLLDLRADAERAAYLAESWLYVAPSGALGFPTFMAEAMALGLPCVAWDTPYHRDVIHHGLTGFLCRDAGEVLERMAELLGSPELRADIGEAAREQARSRFDGRKFRDSVLSIYGTLPRAP